MRSDEARDEKGAIVMSERKESESGSEGVERET